VLRGYQLTGSEKLLGFGTRRARRERERREKDAGEKKDYQGEVVKASIWH
jgi:hypothetical protein